MDSPILCLFIAWMKLIPRRKHIINKCIYFVWVQSFTSGFSATSQIMIRSVYPDLIRVLKYLAILFSRSWNGSFWYRISASDILTLEWKRFVSTLRMIKMNWRSLTSMVSCCAAFFVRDSIYSQINVRFFQWQDPSPADQPNILKALREILQPCRIRSESLVKYWYWQLNLHDHVETKNLIVVYEVGY